MIGIVSRKDYTPTKKEAYVVYSAINYVIKNYHEIGIGILPNNFLEITNVLNLCDGVILQGGDDFTNLDLDIVAYLHKHNIPTLGICLGMQTMAYLFNGSLIRVSNHDNNNHQVIIKNSKIYQDRIINVNSRHHDGVLKTDLNIVGRASDGTIEMIEDSIKDFFVGVLWHPENIFDDKDAKELFDKFFDAVKSHKKE